MEDQETVQPAPETDNGTELQDEVENIENEATGEVAIGDDVAEDSPTPTPEDKPRRDNVQKRIDKITGAKYAAERRAEKAEQEAAYLRGMVDARQEPEGGGSPTKPKIEDFDSDEEHIIAVAEYAANKRFKEMEERRAQEDQTRQERASVNETFNRYDQRVVEFLKTNPDYDPESVANLPISEDVGRAIVSSDQGPAVAHYLCKNPAEVTRISGLTSVLDAAREIGKIEARLGIPQRRTPNNTPSPMEPVNARGSTVQKPTHKMSDKEWNAWDDEQEAAWRARKDKD